MMTLNILKYPDPRLRMVAKPVTELTGEISELIDNMFKTMYEAPGIGLAATQVNVHKCIIVIDISAEKNEPLVLINPEITVKNGSKVTEEGCLSVPAIYGKVERAESITVEAFDRNWQAMTIETDGFLAVCIQHEIDHLEGKMFVDYLSPLKQQRISKKLEKNQKLEEDRRIF